jgi:intein-encoded DNA endonuclease-like protein
MKKLELDKDLIKKLYLEGNSAYIISKQLKCSERPVQVIIRELGIMRTHSESCKLRTRNPTGKKNEDFFETIDTEEKAYWLGFLMADGCVNLKAKRVQLALAETEPLEKFKKSIESNQDIKKYVKKNGDVTYRLDITSEKMCNDLIKYGCVPKKTYILKFPNIQKDLEKHFIRGYFDGDGSIFFNKPIGNYIKPTIHIVGNKEFLSVLKEKLNLDEYKMTLLTRHPERNNNIRHFTLDGKTSCKKFFNFVYKDATIYLERKYIKFTTI